MAVVETERHGQMLVVRMNRPERLNALNHEMRTRLAETWTEFRHDDGLEVAIFTGTGRGFCAGEDMKESLQRGVPGGQRPAIEDPFMSGALEKPVIAAVNGFAMGGGFMLVERTDLRVAVREAVFEVSEAKRWLLGGYNHGHLANLPYPIAMEMALGFRFTAERFYEIGFLNRLVEADQLIPSAIAMAEHLLTLPPASRVNTVHMMRQMRPMPDAGATAPGGRPARARRQERPDGIARRLRREASAQLQRLGQSRGPLPPPHARHSRELTILSDEQHERSGWPARRAQGARPDRAHGRAVLHDDPRRYGGGGRQARTPGQGGFGARLGRRQRAQPLFPLHQPQQEGHHPRLQTARKGRRCFCGSSKPWMCWSRTIARP